MTQLDVESAIDILLIFIVDDLESSGAPPSAARFNFDEGQEDRLNLIKQHANIEPIVQKVLNTCRSRGLIKQTTMGGGQYNSVMLTSEGQARAMSVKLAKPKPQQTETPPIVINTFNAHAPTQVGHGNIMNLETFHSTAISRIDASDASPQVKEEAKSLLSRTLKHPLLCSIIGGLVGAVVPGYAAKG